MSNKINILSTVIMPQSLIDMAAGEGMLLEGVSFIEVTSDVNEEADLRITEYSTRFITAVFTSANAVRAISYIVSVMAPEWDIYCIGHATKQAVLEYFDESAIKGYANDAAELAEAIIRNNPEDVIFFCGDKRMDTLPDMLKKRGVELSEEAVYITTETPIVIGKEYDGILFFSPSSVHSFFSVNKPAVGTVLFAIGNTTAVAIKGYSDNKIVICKTPSKEEMVSDAIKYFKLQAAEKTAG